MRSILLVLLLFAGMAKAATPTPTPVPSGNYVFQNAPAGTTSPIFDLTGFPTIGFVVTSTGGGVIWIYDSPDQTTWMRERIIMAPGVFTWVASDQGRYLKAYIPTPAETPGGLGPSDSISVWYISQ